jgi:7-alpha-hydroxysteroid dehydrogenase
MTILDRFTLTDHVAIVTGAGRGIGAATAVAFAQAGADVVISSRTADQLEAVADQVRDAGRRALVVAADLSDLDAVAGLAGAAYDEFGRIDSAAPSPTPSSTPTSTTSRRRSGSTSAPPTR